MFQVGRPRSSETLRRYIAIRCIIAARIEFDVILHELIGGDAEIMGRLEHKVNLGTPLAGFDLAAERGFWALGEAIVDAVVTRYPATFDCAEMEREERRAADLAKHGPT